MDGKIFSIEELLSLNELMLGRGMPTQDDGVGYNKADYGSCSRYFNGLSDAQLADLSKRLIKYCETQLDLDKGDMKRTEEYYKGLIQDDIDRKYGISIEIGEDETLISFKYNELFIDIIKFRPVRKYNSESKQWSVPNYDLINTLKELEKHGADVKNSIQYAKDNGVEDEIKKIDVLVKDNGDDVYLKFNYNRDVIEEIRKTRKDHRSWNNKYKYWMVKKTPFNVIKDSIEKFANLRYI